MTLRRSHLASRSGSWWWRQRRQRAGPAGGKPIAAALALALALMLAVAGCGTGTSVLTGSKHPAPSAAPGVPASTVRVIVGWADALRAGHIATAAGYFSEPSIFFLGTGPPLQLHSLGEAEAANAALPCGATFISARPRGRYVDVLFRLTNRAGRGGTEGCGSGTGETARTDFLIRRGRILQWLRAPDEPGDNGSPKTPASPQGPTSPQTPTAPGQIPGGGTPLA